MNDTTYTLHPYDHRLDAGLAQMWNESDDQWPGTFTDGVPFTEQIIAEWMDKLEAIIRFVVVEDQTGKVVGYGDLWNTAVRPKSCYVALLNVHPEHQGKSLARRMLVEMVDWAVANGYDRMTIGTWPANLKAMPLYKKVGFFWKPDTTVHMENYLPAARLLPAAADYFSRHNWYGTYDRSLAQVEDEMTHPGTGKAKVYVLRWQSNGDLLETVYDRNAQALSGIETNDWAVYARTGESEPAQGRAYPFEWEFRNKTERPIRILAEARPDEGISLAFEEEVRLEAGETRVLGTTFQVGLDAPKYRDDHEDIPTPRIRTLLEVDGQPLELGTGLKYGPAVEFSLHPQVATLLPGRPQTVHLQLKNRTKTELSGALQLEAPAGLALESPGNAFTVPAEGFAGFPLTVTADRPGVYPLRAAAAIDDGGAPFSTKAKTLALAAIAPGGWSAGEGDAELVLENDFFRIIARAKGGEALVWNKDTDREDGRLLEEIGPAFVPWDLNELEYDLHLDQTPAAAVAVMTVRSARFPGLVVGREITVTGSPLIRVTGWVRNETDAAFPNIELRPHVRIWSENRRTVAVPLPDRVVHEHGSQYGIAEGDFPKKQEGFGESWVAYGQYDRVFGLIWSGERPKELDAEFGRHFFYFSLPLGPGETRRIETLHIYSGPGDWRTVQGAWRRMAGAGAGPVRHAIPAQSRAGSYLDLAIEPRPLLAFGPEVEGRLKLTSPRKFALAGTIDVVPPDGWSADPAAIAYEVDAGRPLDVPIRLTTDGEAAPGAGAPGARAGELKLRSQAFERSAAFTVVRLSNPAGVVSVEAGTESGYDTWRIDNGAARWTVVPAFHGGVTAWRTAGSEANHLYSPFPESGELSWLKPVFGGIRPVLHQDEADGWPGKLHEETFSSAPVTVTDGLGLAWRGVRLEADVKAERYRGLRAILDYLSLPGSSVLKCVFRLENGTPVYRSAQHGWFTLVQVDGDRSKSVLHTPDYTRQRTTISTWGIHDTWAAVSNPETGRALAAIQSTGDRRLLAIDMGEPGAHVYLRQSIDVAPNGSAEQVAYFALAETIEQARAYASLADL